jgi:6-phosphogluconolactonase/glucosamine-6-phosphate isomerase/deaminase
MLRALAGEPVPWPEVHLFQVDERVAPARDPDRRRAFWNGTAAGAKTFKACLD